EPRYGPARPDRELGVVSRRVLDAQPVAQDEGGGEPDDDRVGPEQLACPKRGRQAERQDLQGEADRPANRELPGAARGIGTDRAEDQPSRPNHEGRLVREVADDLIRPHPPDQPQDQPRDTYDQCGYGENSVTAAITRDCSSSISCG